MRALAHPVRLALLEVLADEGRLTATEAGETVGESPANASFHLRQLAKYGFVEEAEGGTGRGGPGSSSTSACASPTSTRTRRPPAPPARSTGCSATAASPARERALEERHAWPEEWRAVTGTNQFRFYLTPDELKQLDADILKLALDRFGDRRSGTAPRPEGRSASRS